MAFLNEIKYKRELEKILFPENAFIEKGKTDFRDGSTKTVNYPVSAEINAVKSGSPSLPLAIENTEHTSEDYTTEQIYATPELVKNEDEMLTNYRIFEDIRDQQAQKLQTVMHDIAAYNWANQDTSRAFLTTGRDESGGTQKYRATSMVGSTTGNRFRIGKLDILQIRNMLTKDNMGGDGQIYGLITPDMYEDLLLIEDFISYEKTGQTGKLTAGLVGKVMGVEFMERWNPNLGHAGVAYTQAKARKENYNANGTVKATAADDGAGAIFFKTPAVRCSRMPIDVAINRQAPGYLGGTILEAWTRFGGRISRPDEKGVVTLIEGKKSQ